MTTQTQIELALTNWYSGNKDEFKNIIKKETNNILNYKESGMVWSYFLPTLLIKEFWIDLQDTGFPLEKVVESNRDIVSWLAWKEATDYMYNKNPILINDLLQYGISEEEISPMLFFDDVNLNIVLDYQNSGISILMKDAINLYTNMEEKDWQLIIDNLKSNYSKKLNKSTI